MLLYILDTQFDVIIFLIYSLHVLLVVRYVILQCVSIIRTIRRTLKTKDIETLFKGSGLLKLNNVCGLQITADVIYWHTVELEYFILANNCCHTQNIMFFSHSSVMSKKLTPNPQNDNNVQVVPRLRYFFLFV